jgi:lipopolysaccharide biosynthesis protein
MPQWDRTPRVNNYDGIYVDATPENFLKHIEHAINVIKDKPKEHRILFLKSWNEWGEGNYVEPDTEFGHGWLDAIKKSLENT